MAQRTFASVSDTAPEDTMSSGTTTVTIYSQIMKLAFLILCICGALQLVNYVERTIHHDRATAQHINSLLQQTNIAETDFYVSRDTLALRSIPALLSQAKTYCESLSSSSVHDSIRSLRTEYANTFDALHIAMQQRGLNEQNGAEGIFRKAAHSMQSRIEASNDMSLMVALLTTRRNEKDYLLRKREQYVGDVQKNILDLQTKIQTTSFKPDVRDSLLGATHLYVKNFMILVQALKKADARHKELRNLSIHLQALSTEMTVVAQVRSTIAGYVTWGIFCVALLIGFIVARNIARKLTQPIRTLDSIAQSFGHTTASPSSSEHVGLLHHLRQEPNEIGNLAGSFSEMIEAVQTANITLRMEKESVEERIRHAIQESEHNRLYLASRVQELLAVMARFKEGDLSARIEPAHAMENDHLYRLFLALNEALMRVDSALGEVQSENAIISQAVVSLTASNATLNTSAQHQQTMLHQSTLNIQQLITAVQRTDSAIRESVAEMNTLRTVALHGEVSVHKADTEFQNITSGISAVREAMVQLMEQIIHVNDASELIRDISEQTNLLALNASIEAARAGEAGRGFAIVAEKIKALADSAGESSKNIAKRSIQIRSNTQHVETALHTMYAVTEEGGRAISTLNQSFSDIKHQVLSASKKADEAVTSAQEQLRITEHIDDAIQSLTHASHNVVSALDEVSTLAQTLADQSQQLTYSVERFSVTSSPSEDITQQEQRQQEQRQLHQKKIQGRRALSLKGTHSLSQYHVYDHKPSSLSNGYYH